MYKCQDYMNDDTCSLKLLSSKYIHHTSYYIHQKLSLSHLSLSLTLIFSPLKLS